MKIAFVHTDLRLYWHARLQALQQQTKKNGWHFQVIEIAGDGSPYAFSGANSLPGNEWWSIIFPNDKMENIPPSLAAMRLYQELDKVDPDVVVAGAIAFPSGAASVRWARQRGKRVIIFDDARMQDVVRNGLVNWVKRRIHNNVDAILTPAPSHIPDYQRFGFRLEQIFFGVDVVDNVFFQERAVNARHDIDKIREQFGLPKRFLLGVGRQILKKNWHGALDAWQKFKELYPASDLSLVLVGNGPCHDALRTKVQHSGIPDVYFYDFMGTNDISLFYACAEGLLLTSNPGETWGLVVNEAMAAGLPVLISRACGCAQTLVQEEINGWLFDGGSESDICDAIIKLDQVSPVAWQAMSGASQALISNWGLERFVRGVCDAVDFVVVQPTKKIRVVDRLILKLWNGRYRPV